MTFNPPYLFPATSKWLTCALTGWVKACLLVTIALLSGHTAQAQLRVDISGTGAQQYPIAIADFSGDPAGVQIAEIIRADLTRSGQFRLIGTSGAALTVDTTIAHDEWRTRGADFIAYGSVLRLPDGRFEIKYRLGDTVKRGPLDGWIVAAGVPRAARFGGGVAGTGPGGRIMPVDEIALPGDHSISNVLAAISAGLVAGVAPDAIRAAVSGFRGIPHRLETVAVLDGIRYVNDAQATQPDAVAAAVRSFRKPLVLLAGGRSKGLDLTELAPIIAAQCSGAVLFGELSDELEGLFRGAGLQRIDRATSIPDAAARGGAMARALLTETVEPASASLHESEARATVLLSPIGSSFDMFNNPFGARGDAFRAAVLELPAEHRA